jgi:DNA-binding PadR family transcriptional regulator
MMLKTNWFYILLSLSGQEQHGYGIMNGTLKRLIDEGLIEESDERPAPELDDARRRYYRLTPAGKQVLNAESERLEKLVGVLRKRRLEAM